MFFKIIHFYPSFFYLGQYFYSFLPIFLAEVFFLEIDRKVLMANLMNNNAGSITCRLKPAGLTLPPSIKVWSKR